MRRSVVGLLLIATFLVGLSVGRSTAPEARPDFAGCRVLNIVPALNPDGSGAMYDDHASYHAIIQFPDNTTATLPVSVGLAQIQARGISGIASK